MSENRRKNASCDLVRLIAHARLPVKNGCRGFRELAKSERRGWDLKFSRVDGVEGGGEKGIGTR